MSSPRSENSERPANPQHRAQLIWTGVVALFLAVVALQQASSPALSTVAPTAPDPVLTGINLGAPSTMDARWETTEHRPLAMPGIERPRRSPTSTED